MNFEFCGEVGPDVIIRPTKRAIHIVVWGMLLQVVSGFLSFVGALGLATLITSIYSNADDSAGYEVFLALIPGLLSYGIYVIPFVAGILYIIFGADLFLFRWLDDAMIFFIYQWIAWGNWQIILWSDFFFIFGFSNAGGWSIIHTSIILVFNAIFVLEWFWFMNN